ncbi:MAG: SusC/RagA family TonB-linked outer membrane protein [Bacteroidota bacterium]
MNKKLLLLGAALLLCGIIFAQKTITGTVTYQLDGQPFIGATVYSESAAMGTSTDLDGSYSLTLPDSAMTLVFSAIGMESQEVIIGTDRTIDIALREALTTLQSVVITALGQEAERDKSATSIATIGGEDVAQSGETSLLTGLSAKAPGVLITRNGGDPGAGAYIQIRGQNTINGDAQPLFVVDGMPVSNTSSSLGAARSNGIVQQSRINDINPEDIERIEVLRGAAAAALWGTRAANGVIIITTKKGKNTEGRLRISYKGSYSIDEVNKMHPLQRAYGQGSNGLFIQGARTSFGDLIADRPGGADDFITDPNDPAYAGFITFQNGEQRYALASGTPNNPNGGKNSRETFDHGQDAFDQGYFFENNITLSGGNDKANFLFNFSDLQQEGVIKAFSDYNRNTARLNSAYRFNSWLNASAKVGYSRIESSRVQEGDNVDGILLSSLRTPPDFDNGLFTGVYTNPAGESFPDANVGYRNPLGFDQNTIYSNPIWNINNNSNTSEVDRILGTVELNLTPLAWLSGTARVGIDNYTDDRVERFARNSGNFSDGALSISRLSEQQFNTDLFAIAKTELNDDFQTSFLFGFNYNSRRSTGVVNAITDFIIPTAPDILTNALNSNLSATNSMALIRTYAFYAQLDIEAYRSLFVTLTGRNEAASTFGSETDDNFFFPSASLAWQFSDLLQYQNRGIFSFGKLRLSWGQVGIQPQPYLNFTTFIPASYGDDFTNGLSALSPLYGGGFVRSAVLGNEFLRPERKTETELGIDLRFFNNRVSFSSTVYLNRTEDVILPLSIPNSTGFTTVNSNAAELENRGLEIDFNVDAIKTKDFIWNIAGNFSANRNEVVSLAGATAYTLPSSFIQNASLIPGQPFGVFLSTDFLKDDSGEYILDANGFPQPGFGTEIIGDPNPDWRAGLGTTLRYKNFLLYLLFDSVQGLDFFNGTRGSLYAFGTHGDQGNTAIAPAGGIKDVNGNTIPAGTAFQGNIVDFGAGPVALNQAWYQGRGTASNTASYRQFVEDASNTRLREVTLSYSIRNQKFNEITKLASIDLRVTGRNLVLWTDYSGVDPESNISGASLARGQDWFTNPNTRSVIFTLSVNY